VSTDQDGGDGEKMLEELKSRLAKISDLENAAAVLDWDQQTFMPPGGAEARAEQRATLATLSHELFTAGETGTLLEQSERERDGAEPESDEVALLRVTRRDYERAVKLPADLVAEITRTRTLAQEVWTKARPRNDYASFAPWLEKTIELTRRAAECWGYQDRLYDPLLDQYEPGTTTAQVEAMFKELKPGLVSLVKAIVERGAPLDDAVLHREFDVARQREFSERLVRAIGYDFTHGRQDTAAHPFCTSFSRDDVRITTRFDPRLIAQALLASMHEAGHALYEQGSPVEFDRGPLRGGASMGVHESQSRLWENMVGRSKGFWQHFFTALEESFPDQLADTDAEGFWRAVCKVTPSCIRVEADEVTYNLHVMLRFELENELLEGRLSVADAPAAWNRKMQEYLGVTPPNDSDGILQDIHWSLGIMGYFPTYSIGNLLAAQLWEKASSDMPGLTAQIARGEFAPLLGWLREKIHRHGRKYLPNELIPLATGEALQSRSYLRYLTEKYSELYSL
jgi:carboxypeptidase Taq